MNAQEVAPVDLSAAMDPSKAGGFERTHQRLVGCEVSAEGGCGNSFWNCGTCCCGFVFFESTLKEMMRSYDSWMFMMGLS